MRTGRTFLGVVCLMVLIGCSSKQKTETTEPITVKTIVAASTSESGNRTYVGTVEESYGSSLSFSGLGTVSQVVVDEGQAVKKGQVLAVLDKSTVMNSYDIAKSTLKQAQDAYKRMNGLYKKGSLPEIKFIETQTQLVQAQAAERIARKSISDCVLRAPFSGYISQRMVDVGNNVTPGLSCFKLVKIDHIKIKVSIPEQEISKIKIGQGIGFTVSALDNRSYMGRVIEKGVQANALSHTYDVKLALANPGHELMPGMVCNVAINTQQANNAIIVPQEAVMLDANGTKFVWVAEGSMAQKKAVTTGDANNQGVVIIGGLNNGDQVIVNGQNKVSEGSKIKLL
jgi:membrane fusion protein, multidrug efflux system